MTRKTNESGSTAPRVKGSRAAEANGSGKPSDCIKAKDRPYLPMRDQKVIQEFLGAMLADVEVAIKGARLLARGSELGSIQRRGLTYWENVRSAIYWLSDRSAKRQAYLYVKKQLEAQQAKDA